jgi:hypothetical protein
MFSKVKALGIDIPATLLGRANEVIEERSSALDGSAVGPPRRLAQHIQKFGATRKSPSEGKPTQSARRGPAREWRALADIRSYNLLLTKNEP